MTKKPYILIGAVASAAIALTGCEVAGDETNVFSADNMAYTQDEIQMMVAGVLKNHIEQPRLSAEKVIKYQLASDNTQPKEVDVTAQFAYKLAEDEEVQAILTNGENGQLTEVQTKEIKSAYKEQVKNANQTLNNLIDHIGNALSANVTYEKSGNIKVLYNVSNYIQELTKSFDESLVYVEVELDKDYSLLSAKELFVNEVGEKQMYMSYDTKQLYKEFK